MKYSLFIVLLGVFITSCEDFLLTGTRWTRFNRSANDIFGKGNGTLCQ